MSPTSAEAAELEQRFQRAWDALAAVPTLHERRGAELGWLDRRRLRRATEDLEACHAIDSSSARVRWGLGRARHAAGDLEAARPHFEAAAAAFPGDADVASELALVSLGLGDGAAAERWARVAADLRPGDSALLVTYAITLVVAGSAKRALGVIANVCKRHPDDAAARRAIELVRKVLNGDVPAPERWTAADG